MRQLLVQQCNKVKLFAKSLLNRDERRCFSSIYCYFLCLFTGLTKRLKCRDAVVYFTCDVCYCTFFIFRPDEHLKPQLGIHHICFFIFFSLSPNKSPSSTCS